VSNSDDLQEMEKISDLQHPTTPQEHTVIALGSQVLALLLHQVFRSRRIQKQNLNYYIQRWVRARLEQRSTELSAKERDQMISSATTWSRQMFASTVTWNTMWRALLVMRAKRVRFIIEVDYENGPSTRDEITVDDIQQTRVKERSED